MSTPLGTYSFLPWFRQGLANQITSADLDAAVILRAEVQVQLELRGQRLGGGEQVAAVNRAVALFGPSDIQGIESRAIVRVEPRHWITNFEPNFLPQIEFYDEDFPWRYTPAAPDVPKGRLRPWIMLVVLDESEFTDGQDARNKPLPYIDVPDANVFPPAEQLWAWAHVHVNRSLAANDAEFRSTDGPAVAGRLRAVLDENPDLAFSRIICPRKLEPDRPYHAFLVPVFEGGRLSGLGLPLPNDLSATASAWGPGRTDPTRYPFYYRWYFRTGATGDFESLVRLLRPVAVDHRVGTRDLDVQDPGLNVRGETKPELGGILKLGGALRVPRKNFEGAELAELLKYENWATPYPRPIQQDLARLINLEDDYTLRPVNVVNAARNIRDAEDPTQLDPDPLITLPLYGRWHALTRRLLTARNDTALFPDDNWIHELNLDPRFRVAAGIGTRVVQEQQEKLMDAAWEQVGKVLEASRRIRFGQLAKEVSSVWYDRHLRPAVSVSTEKGLLLMAPLNKRVLSGDVTVHHRLTESFVQPTMTSAPLRRVLRPRGRFVKLTTYDGANTPANLLTRVNDGRASAAPPKVTPPGAVTVNDVADATLPGAVPSGAVGPLRRWPWLRWLPFLIALLLIVLLFLFAPFATAAAAALAVAAAAFALFRQLSRWSHVVDVTDGLRDDHRSPEEVDDLPNSPDFRISVPGDGFTPTLGAADSPEATRFKGALRDVFTLVTVSAEAGAVPAKNDLDLPALAGGVFQSIDPTFTVPRRVMAGIFLPPRVRREVEDRFVEPMAYPVFDTPMYEALKNLSSELFLPNINLLEQNSVTILETNQKFIEAYMVGLNHEFGRELLWREYPTDQRGSYFRQFWDVRSFFNREETIDDETLKERLRDIPPIHLWSINSKLEEHDHRERQPGRAEQEVVLVIRGELLKRYPTAVIYAHHGCWQRKDDGTPEDLARHPCFRSGDIDNTKERRLEPLLGDEETNPPHEKLRMPLYEAKVDPDIYFFGFDLTVETAVGGTGANPDDEPGWFFVIEERPGEPRFGLDIDGPPADDLKIWGDLSWSVVQPAPAGSYIQITNATPTLTLVEPTGPDEEKKVQFDDDTHITWSKDMTSADLAYILLQAPVRVAIHASEMLPR